MPTHQETDSDPANGNQKTTIVLHTELHPWTHDIHSHMLLNRKPHGEERMGCRAIARQLNKEGIPTILFPQQILTCVGDLYMLSVHFDMSEGIRNQESGGANGGISSA